jgi:hypothetical protein
MVTSEQQLANGDDSRRKIIIVVAIVAAVLVAGLFYLLMRAGGSAVSTPVRLEGAIRAGSPEFEKYGKLIVCDEPEADQAGRALGDIVMTLRTTVRNFTGRTINGLEVWAAVVDHQGKPVKQRTVVVMPNDRRSELEPNKTMVVEVVLDGMSNTDDRANIKMEVAGFRFK